MHSAFPGYEIVEAGLRDLRAGRETLNALLVSMAVEKLRGFGYTVPNPVADPEIRCYQLLSRQLGDGAHSRYNAYRRRLASFLRAASCATLSTPSESESS